MILAMGKDSRNRKNEHNQNAMGRTLNRENPAGVSNRTSMMDGTIAELEHYELQSMDGWMDGSMDGDV